MGSRPTAVPSAVRDCYCLFPDHAFLMKKCHICFALNYCGDDHSVGLLFDLLTSSYSISRVSFLLKGYEPNNGCGHQSVESALPSIYVLLGF